MLEFEEIFPHSLSLLHLILDADFWYRAGLKGSLAAFQEELLALIAEPSAARDLPPYLADLVRLEAAVFQVRAAGGQPLEPVTELTINAELQLLATRWAGLVEIVAGLGSFAALPESSDAEFILVFRHPESRKVIVRRATNSELLALKIISEGLTPVQAAAVGPLSREVIDQVLADGVGSGILLRPQSLIRRPAEIFPAETELERDFLSSDFFTLQWHVTQQCDLHCRHCYDRSVRPALSLSDGLRILDDLHSFCEARFVRGQVSFSGGNPLLYPYFMELYAAAVARGLQVAILGNPTDRKTLAALAAIKAPVFYQISLEGLAPHNDYMRGRGHFQRSLEFLELLQEFGFFSMVMLTLTRANLDQVLPLAEFLRGRVDLFTFNRLALVGEGAALYSVEPAGYRAFLEQYLAAAEENSLISLKDNLFNIIKNERSQPLFGGCAGYGCGAAFNFLSLLPDGEVHACRKLPSLLGNILTEPLAEIYDSAQAQRYRQGTAACKGCTIRSVCGGCPAVVHGLGLDIFTDKDPYCFISSGKTTKFHEPLRKTT